MASFFSKKFLWFFLLNFFIVFFINVIAYFFSNQIDINLFITILAYLVIFSFIAIIADLLFYSIKNIYQKKHNYYIFLCLLIIFFYTKFNYFWEYFYFRYENYVQFKMYFLDSFQLSLNYLIWDFRNFNWVVLINSIKEFLIPVGITQQYIYAFFNFIGAIYLYKIFRLFSKDNLVPMLLVFVFLWIEQIFIASFTITYVNIIISSFIIFLYYLFYLEKNKNTYGYIFYTLSYLFLITSRPDFFFLALIIEFLNAYFKWKNIISLFKNIFFYVFLIPYYFVINNYLLFNIHKDVWLLWGTYSDNNFWTILLSTFFSGDFFYKIYTNIIIISKDLFFSFIFLFVVWYFSYLVYHKKIKNIFSYIFLLLYALFFFFIVIFIHIEWFDHSIFKYFPIIYITFFILFGLFLLKILKWVHKEEIKEKIYMGIILLLIINLWNSLYSYNKFVDMISQWQHFDYDYKISMNARSYDALYNTNILFHKVHLEGKIKKECRVILIWDMSHEYNSLFPENIWLYKNKGREIIQNIKNEKCINLFVFSERHASDQFQLNKELFSGIQQNFDTEIMYDRYIEDKFWLNLYIMKNKNVK